MTIIVLSLSLPVHAWAPAAYPIVGALIEPYLSADAHALLEQLLPIPVQHPGAPALAAATDTIVGAGAWLPLAVLQPNGDAAVSDARLLLLAGDTPQSACTARRAAASIARRRRVLPDNVLDTLDAALVTLRQADATPVERARALRVTMATVTALHQPLRVFDPDTPQRNGSARAARLDGVDLPILGPRPATMPAGTVGNLWDTAAGLYPQWPAVEWARATPALPKGWRTQARAFVPVVRQRAKGDTWVDIGTPERWAEESWRLGCEWAHGGAITWERATPGVLTARFADPAAAIDDVQQRSALQLMRAARRLAALLNMLADPYVHPTLTKYMADLASARRAP